MKVTLQQTLIHTDCVSAVVFSPDGLKIASASNDDVVWLWDLATGTPQKKFKGHTDSVMAVVFSPNGSKLASA